MSFTGKVAVVTGDAQGVEAGIVCFCGNIWYMYAFFSLEGQSVLKLFVSTVLQRDKLLAPSGS